MKEFMPLLSASPIFNGVEEREIFSMLRCLDVKESLFQRGEYILRAGEPAGDMGLLLTGSALVAQEDFWGNRNIMARVSPGQLFAEAFACAPGAELTVSVVAEEGCRVLFLNVSRVLTTCPTACAHHSRVIRNLLAELAVKNLGLNEKMTHMARRSTREKLRSYLSAQARRQGSADFSIPFSRQQLADYLSVERSGLSAELGKMRDEGILDFYKNHFTLYGLEEDQ